LLAFLFGYKMSVMKKLVLLSTLIFMSTNLMAANKRPAQRLPGSSGGSLGTVYDSKIESFAPYLQLFDQNITLGFGISSDKSNVSPFNFDQAEFTQDMMKRRFLNFIGHVGMRGALMQNLFGSVGISGAYMWDREDSSSTQMALGPFIGIDIPILRYLMFSGQISRPLYTREAPQVERDRKLKSFGGLFGISYMF